MPSKQHSTLTHLAETLTEFESLINALPPDGLEWKEAEGEWSIRAMIHHLTDDGNAWLINIEKGLATPGCKIYFGEFIGNDPWAEQLAFEQRPVEPAMALIRAQRDFLMELAAFFPDRWENTVGFYNTAGEMRGERTVGYLIGMLADHMQDHIQTIHKIVEANQPK